MESKSAIYAVTGDFLLPCTRPGVYWTGGFAIRLNVVPPPGLYPGRAPFPVAAMKRYAPRTSSVVAVLRCCALVVPLFLTSVGFADPARVAYDRGNEAIAHEDYPAAIRHFSMAVQLNPRMNDAWFSRAWAHSRMGNTEQEVADLSQCIRLAPNYAEAYCNRGAAYARLGRLDLALTDLNHAIGLNPGLTIAWVTRGWVRSQRGQHREAVADYTQALKQEPKNVDVYRSRAKCFSALGEFDRAVADLDRVLDVYPEDPDLLGSRGAAKVAKGDLAGGTADLAEAIRRNPHDAGAKYVPWKKVDISPESLEHGEQQLRAMLKDRPSLAKYLVPDSVLWKWAVRRLAGEALGEPIDWDPALPLDSEAEHVAPMDGRHGRIRVKPFDAAMPQAEPIEVFEALWSHVVFELHNIGFVPRFEALRRQAAEGRISKRQFVERVFRYEHEAIQQTRAFYVKVQLPWTAENGWKTDPGLWFADWWIDVETAFADFTDPREYPWVPYARQYDWLRVHALIDADRYRDALVLLQAMLGEKGYAAAAGRVQYWIGECRLELGDLAAALKAANAAIELDPEEAGAYELRAEVYEKLGDGQKAAADRAEAMRLDEAAHQGP